MPIISWTNGVTGLAGVQPNIVYINTNDSVATILSPGYLNSAIERGLVISDSDILLISSTTVTNYYSPLISGSSVTLVPTVNTSNIPDYAVVCGPTAADGPLQTVSGLGTLGQVLTSEGPGTLPVWANSGAGGGITAVSGTVNQISVLNPTTTPIISISGYYAGQATINTLGTISTGLWHGTTIDVSYGGTGRTAITAYGMICGGTTSTGPMQDVGTGTSGQVLTSTGATSLPSWQTPPATGVTSVSGTTNNITVTSPTTTPVVSIASTYSGQTSLSVLGTVTTGTWNSDVINPAYGGTGVNNGSNTLTLGIGFDTINTTITASAPNTTLIINASSNYTSVSMPASGNLLSDATTVNVGQGGTGSYAFIPFSVVGGPTSSPTDPLTSIPTSSTAGYVLTSNGSSAQPSFQAINPSYIKPTVSTARSGSTTGGFSGGTYTTPAGVLYLRIEMVGGGGGGGNSIFQGATANAGTAGTSTTFSSLTAGGGGGGAGGSGSGSVTAGGSAGTYSGVSSNGYGVCGGAGGNASAIVISSGGSVSATFSMPGGIGGATGFSPSAAAASGGNLAGAGGNGGDLNGPIFSGTIAAGGGGGGGGFISDFFLSPAGAYSYTVGAAGSGGAAGSHGLAGGNGSTGFIIVYEYYQ